MEKIVVQMKNTKQWQRDEVEKTIAMITGALTRAAEEAGAPVIPEFNIVRYRE
jgi:hypothetical protein